MQKVLSLFLSVLHLLSFLPLEAFLHAAPSYPDPMTGAPRSFIDRVSELSSLQAETVRQEKLKKIRKYRKTPSWQSPPPESRRFRIRTSESVPKPEENETFRDQYSFQFLALTACLSSVILFGCLTWLILTFWDSWLVHSWHKVWTLVKSSFSRDSKCYEVNI